MKSRDERIKDLIRSFKGDKETQQKLTDLFDSGSGFEDDTPKDFEVVYPTDKNFDPTEFLFEGVKSYLVPKTRKLLTINIEGEEFRVSPRYINLLTVCSFAISNTLIPEELNTLVNIRDRFIEGIKNKEKYKDVQETVIKEFGSGEMPLYYRKVIEKC